MMIVAPLCTSGSCLRSGYTLVPWRIVTLISAVLLMAGCERAPPEPLTFYEVANPAGEGSAQQRLSVGGGGDVVMSWLEPGTEGHALKYAIMVTDGWSESQTVVTGDNLFVNWADTPSVVKISDNLWAAHWGVYQAESYFAFNAIVALSVDGSAWREPFLLHQDGTESEHGFVTLFSQEGSVGAVWLDGRNYIVDGEFLYQDHNGNVLGTALHYAQFSSSGNRLKSFELDEIACDCCLPVIAQSSDGFVLAYRDRSLEERRDIVVRRMSGGNWQDAVLVGADNWIIEACPINGPAIAADGDSVAVAWFSATNNEPYVRLALSADAGKSFGEPIEIDADGSFGHVDLVLTDEGDAIVSWLRSDADRVAITLRRITAEGLVGEAQTVAHIDIGRPADFPQMVKVGRQLVFAWSDFDGNGKVRTAVAEITP
ncbi:MAG: sialidase family protein [Candidatus Rariloculaceae bacterium]